MFRIGAERFKNQFGVIGKSLRNSKKKTGCFCSPPPEAKDKAIKKQKRPPAGENLLVPGTVLDTSHIL